METAAKDGGAQIIRIVERGYQQIRIELQSLSRSIAVSYPLVEIFVTQLKGDLKGEAGFLTKIIWSDGDEVEAVQRIASAAFGPLSVLLEPSAEQPKK